MLDPDTDFTFMENSAILNNEGFGIHIAMHLVRLMNGKFNKVKKENQKDPIEIEF